MRRLTSRRLWTTPWQCCSAALIPQWDLDRMLCSQSSAAGLAPGDCLGRSTDRSGVPIIATTRATGYVKATQRGFRWHSLAFEGPFHVRSYLSEGLRCHRRKFTQQILFLFLLGRTSQTHSRIIIFNFEHLK